MADRERRPRLIMRLVVALAAVMLIVAVVSSVLAIARQQDATTTANAPCAGRST